MTASQLALTMAKDLFELGKLDEAAEVLAPFVARADATPATLWLAGRIAGLKGELRVGIGLMERALVLAPTAAPIYEDLAFAWAALSRPDVGLEILQEGIATIGPNPSLLASAASCALGTFDPEHARSFLDADPAAPDAIPGVRALLALHEGDWDAAIAAFAAVFGAPTPPPVNAPRLTPTRYTAPLPVSSAPAPKPTIATSLSPRGAAAQHEAVASWCRFAAEIISVNSPEEIATLAPEYPFVRFVATNRHGGDIAGKPLVFLDDVLAALADTNAEFCGIINADIVLLDAARLAADLGTSGADGVTILHRLDLDAVGATDGSPYVEGFDGFFFSRERIEIFRGSRLMLGAPWWDYLLPVLALLHEVPLTIPGPGAIGHVRHQIQWSKVSYLRTAQLWLAHVHHVADGAPSTLARAFMAPFIEQYAHANPWIGSPVTEDPETLLWHTNSLDPLVTTTNHLIRTQARQLGASG